MEFAVYGAPGELPELAEGEAEVGGVRVVVSGSGGARRLGGALEALPLARCWWAAGSGCARRGSRRPSAPGVIDLVIDPGRAFGTGAHPTTRLCLELLLELAEAERGSLCDLGCGSGVLAIAAARLGFGPVTALDSDRLAVEATAANARDNGVALGARGAREPARRAAAAGRRGGGEPDAPAAAAGGRADARAARAALIVSGLLEEEADEVAAAFAPLGERRRLTDRGWTALLLGG